MHTIALIAQKGGTGKTTIALSLAVAATQVGKKTAIIDLDPQCSAMDWFDRREAPAPEVLAVPLGRLAKTIETAREAGYELVIIDTPGKAADTQTEAAKHADLVLIPCRPQLIDLNTLPATRNILAASGSPKAAVLLSAVPVQGRYFEDARAAVQGIGMPVVPFAINHRASYGHAYTAALGVSELEPNGKATSEITQLYTYTRGLLEGTDDQKQNIAACRASR